MTNFESGTPKMNVGSSVHTVVRSSGGFQRGETVSVNAKPVDSRVREERALQVGVDTQDYQARKRVVDDSQKTADRLERHIDSGGSIEETLKKFVSGEFSAAPQDEAYGNERNLLEGNVVQEIKNPDYEDPNVSGKDGPPQKVVNEKSVVQEESIYEKQNRDSHTEEVPDHEPRIQALEERVSQIEKRVGSMVERGEVTPQQLAAAMYELMKMMEEKEEDEEEGVLAAAMRILFALISFTMKSLAEEQEIELGKKPSEKKDEENKRKPVSFAEYLSHIAAKHEIPRELLAAQQRGKDAEKNKNSGGRRNSSAKAA